MNNGIKWLHCTASLGQFQDELALHGKDYQNTEFSLFTARKYVELSRKLSSPDDQVDAMLRVVIVDEKRELCLVKLPGQTFENGSTITVRAEQLDDVPVQHA